MGILSEEELTPLNQEQRIKDALRPFYFLAAEVGRNNSGLKDDRVLYGYNRVEIKFSDLLRVIEVYESLPVPAPLGEVKQ